VLRNAYRCLKPGGWIEHTEITAKIISNDGTIPPARVYDWWNDFFTEAGERTGKTFNFTSKQNAAWMKETGFKEVNIEEFKVPISPWAKDSTLKSVGGLNNLICGQAMDGVGLRLGTSVLLNSFTEMQVVFGITRQALRDKNSQVYYPWYVVALPLGWGADFHGTLTFDDSSTTWAQKPLAAATEAPPMG